MASCVTDSPLTLSQIDRQYVWHPYTQMLTAKDPIPILRGKGAYLYAEDGTRYIDGISSWWVNLHGHAHPYIVEKIKSQAELLEHVMFADLTHAPAVELAMKLATLLPGELSKIFYSDNGSTAVEAALKIALQYWYNKNSSTKRTQVVCFNKSYHGDTFGAMSASGRNHFNRPFWSHLFEVRSIDPPLRGQEEKSFNQLKEILKCERSACFIFEPLVLGASGMIMYPPAGLDALISACHEAGVITIADEVMTGFGRTGPLFASEFLKEKPDMICLSKGLTGGFLPLGVTACREFIYKAFLSKDPSHAFLHGHSYTGNPLACCSALASLDLLLQNDCTLKRKFIGEKHAEFCKKWEKHPSLKRCESLGTILALEYKLPENPIPYFHSFGDQIYLYFLDRGILLRPLGNVLHVIPPYCIEEEDLMRIYEYITHFTLLTRDHS